MRILSEVRIVYAHYKTEKSRTGNRLEQIIFNILLLTFNRKAWKIDIVKGRCTSLELNACVHVYAKRMYAF